MIRLFTGLIFFLVAVQTASQAKADAVIRTYAMKASTIAQFYIEDTRIQLSLEIGLDELAAFHNLLPEKIRERLKISPEDYATRIDRFFMDDLAILADGKPLRGKLTKIVPSKRVARDPISGSPLETKNEAAQTVIQADLEYELPEKFGELLFSGSRMSPMPNIGFVVYHKGIAVNDFRFLPSNIVLKLDWEDPWYSSFTTRNLRRAYSSPMSGYLYVEPYEVRKEIILRPKDIQNFTDLGLAQTTFITVDMYPVILEKMKLFLADHLPVKIDGKPASGELVRMNFLKRTLTSSRVVDPPEKVNLDAAIVGAIYVFPTDGLPQRVDMDWDLFNKKIDRIAAASVDQAGPLFTYLEPGFTTLTWKNFLKNPRIPTLAVLIKPQTGWQKLAYFGFYLALVSTLIFATFFVVKWVRQKQISKPFLAIAAASLFFSGVSYGPGHNTKLNDTRTHKLVSNLLHNVYRAFDYRKDEQIYDVLAKSVSGDLLSDIFLETKRGLVLENQGGARAKVQEIELNEFDTSEIDNSRIAGNLSWTVKGNVGHWGHIHSRSNRYRAELVIETVNGAWKMTKMQILEEERLIK